MNSAAMTVSLVENFKELKLNTIAKRFEDALRQAREQGIDHADFLLELTEAEIAVRQQNREKRRLKEAHFPLLKTLENFDFGYASNLNKLEFMQLVSGEYLNEHRNVIFLGRSGTGKTHLATALGIEACKSGKRVRFVTACRLVNELSEAKKDNDLQKSLKRYSKYDLLIVDELGYVPISRNGSQLLFQVFADRHELKSVIVTSNLGFADWTQIFEDQNLTAALLDRLTCRAHVFSCTWASYRLASSLNKKS